MCYPLTGPLNLPGKMDRGVLFVLEAMTILAFSMLTYAIWDAMCDAMASRAAGVSSGQSGCWFRSPESSVWLVIIVIVIFVAMSTLFNVNVAAVIASLGLGGIVVALAAKDSVENVIGSITILFDMPFAIGDWVRVDKIEGIVDDINLRSTRIRTFEDTLVNPLNANLILAAVENVQRLRGFHRLAVHSEGGVRHASRQTGFVVRGSADLPPEGREGRFPANHRQPFRHGRCRDECARTVPLRTSRLRQMSWKSATDYSSKSCG